MSSTCVEKIEQSSEAQQVPDDPVVQYIALRNDLDWPLGAIVAQGAHVSVKAIEEFREHEDTQSYLQAVDSMHKVVVGCKDESALSGLKQKLDDNSVDHSCWIEQPEGILVALATRPYVKSAIKKMFRKFPLLRK